MQSIRISLFLMVTLSRSCTESTGYYHFLARHGPCHWGTWVMDSTYMTETEVRSKGLVLQKMRAGRPEAFLKGSQGPALGTLLRVTVIVQKHCKICGILVKSIGPRGLLEAFIHFSLYKIVQNLIKIKFRQHEPPLKR